MSFSGEVRKEICRSVNDKERRFACLYGMLMFSRTLTAEHICFQTESTHSSAMFEKLIKSVFQGRIDFRRHENERKNGAVMFTYDITNPEHTAEILKCYNICPERRSIDFELIANSSLGVFAGGVFLACGSVNDPSKEYHLEFVTPSELIAAELVMLLNDIEITAKTALRRGQYIVYIKDSESIEDTLTFIGAQKCTLEMINVKIYKDVRNKANRIANCDSANIDKVVNAAMRQLEDIKLIESSIGLDSLTDELREVSELRIENSDMSLKEIGECLNPPISRSGVNHRFKKLAKIAEEIRSGGNSEYGIK
ncbi:MAG: DNA-binding protein WhiA [Oscillospiraceae bacterium]|nr:DNA-binding protein WhiA [Oscillospiraceae bacterium]